MKNKLELIYSDKTIFLIIKLLNLTNDIKIE